MTITRSVAQTAVAYLQAYTTPESAAHQARVQLRAIAPYGSRQLEAVITCLDYVARATGDRRVRLQTNLLALDTAPV